MSNFNFQEFLEGNYILIVIIIIIIILVVIYVFYWGSNQNNAISNESFCSPQEERFNKYKVSLYYTDWCGYSKLILPEWDKFVEYMKNKTIPNLVIEKIDCEKNPNLCVKIDGYPTVILSDDKNNNIHMGQKYKRNMQGLIEFIKENTDIRLNF